MILCSTKRFQTIDTDSHRFVLAPNSEPSAKFRVQLIAANFLLSRLVSRLSCLVFHLSSVGPSVSLIW